MSIAVIVQARFGSSRLPGKAVMTLGNRRVLDLVLDRCARIQGVRDVICAIPDSVENDVVARAAEQAGYAAVRGPEDDVLERYVLAARSSSADLVFRVTSDCPFIDPALCSATLAFMLEQGADYGTNTMPARFPHGLDCEVFTKDWLLKAGREASTAFEREHVTPFIREHEQVRTACLLGPGEGVERFRWTLDYPEDYAFCEDVFGRLGHKAETASAAQLAELCRANPDLTAINALRVNRARVEDEGRADVISKPVALSGEPLI